MAEIGFRKPSLVVAAHALLPAAIDWAERTAGQALVTGRPLAFWQVAEARQAGVRKPKGIRILTVNFLPQPEHPQLQALLASGLLAPEAQALTLGCGIFILKSRIGERRLLRRQLSRVAQFEEAGSLGAFFARALGEASRNDPATVSAATDVRGPWAALRPSPGAEKKLFA